MTDDGKRKDVPNTLEVTVNWEGLKRFLAWPGSISELKQVKLDGPPLVVQAKRAATDK